MSVICEFVVSSWVKVELKGNDFNLDLEVGFRFNIDQDLTEEFKVSDFSKINAPVIAFPYVRA